MSRFLHQYRNELGLVVATALVVALAWCFSNAYATAEGRADVARDILRDTSLLGIFALGAATVIIAGGIDLSSGSMIAFSGTLFFGFLILLADDVTITQKIEPERRELTAYADGREFVVAGEAVFQVDVTESSSGEIAMRVKLRRDGRQVLDSVDADDAAALEKESPAYGAVYAELVADPRVAGFRELVDGLDPLPESASLKVSNHRRTVKVDTGEARFEFEDDGHGHDVTVKSGKSDPVTASSPGELAANAAESYRRYVPTVEPRTGRRFWFRFGAPLLAILGVVLAAVLVGSFHAWLITVLELPPFVATLASLVGLRSLARLLIQDFGNLEYAQNKSTITLGSDVLPAVASDDWWIPCVVFAGLAVFMWLFLGRTVVGRHVYAMGGNETAARLSGIRTGRLKWLVYCIGSVTAAIAGVLYSCKIGTASPATDGMGYELNAIAAAVVGGCSLAGGVGSVAGVMMGALFLRVVIDSVAKLFKSQPTLLEGLVVGTLVVLTVAFNELRTTPGTKKSFFPGPLGILNVFILSLLAGVITYVTSTEGKARNALVVAGTVLLLAGVRAGYERLGSRAA